MRPDAWIFLSIGDATPGDAWAAAKTWFLDPAEARRAGVHPGRPGTEA